MDLISLSKVAIVLLLFFIVNRIYKKVDWNSRGSTKWHNKYAVKLDRFFREKMETRLDDVLISISVAISIIPIGLVGFGMPIYAFGKCIEFVSNEGYFSQIVFSFGFILVFYLIRIVFDVNKQEKVDMQKRIEEQKSRIFILEDDIKRLKKNGNISD